MVVSRSTFVVRRSILCLTALLVAFPVCASSASAATAPQNPPASMTAAHRQIAYWRTYALNERALHRLVARQRDAARVELRAERARHAETTTTFTTYRAAVADGIRALGGTDDLGAIINTINAKLGGSGTTLARASTPVSTTPDTSERDALAAQIASANADLGGSGTLAARVAAVNGMLGGNGTTLTRAGDVVSSSLALTTRITDASTVLGGSGTLEARLVDVNTTLGGSGTTLARATVAASGSSALATQIADASTDLGGTGTLAQRITTLNAVLGGTGDTNTRAASLNTELGTTATNVTSGLTEVATAIGSTGTVGARVTNVASALQATPDASLSAAVTTLRTSVGGSASTLDGRINFVAGSVLATPSGVLRDDLSTLRNLLVTSPGATAQADVSSLATKLNGTGSGATIETRVTAIGAGILSSPTSNLASDLSSLRNMLVDTQGVTAQSDVNNLMAKLNGVSSGSSLDARIGNPVTNSMPSSVADMLGGSGSITDRIGDPALASSGIAALIGSSAANAHGFDTMGFTNATTIAGKVTAVTDIFTQSGSVAGSHVLIPNGTFTTFSDIISAMDHD